MSISDELTNIFIKLLFNVYVYVFRRFALKWGLLNLAKMSLNQEEAKSERAIQQFDYKTKH